MTRPSSPTDDELDVAIVGAGVAGTYLAYRWPLQNVHQGEAHFQIEDGEGKPSRWNTLRAIRVLDWFAQGA